ncbi:quorum-sensing phosphorelay protein LuxU [Vibrio porteresiae]|uniref:Phosphorelay protein LuxU n=1 Tax=Vibrio porteresiae DSM 19223 TaxID=1123496 RepID=A0ABZ0Q9Z9_9VIBR|nr:quorum-sensing phosphorelay protein LuxU [Vibrio porteresiae]WPC73272.1 quorum-sensing phosphorelay protein LuxU [Vibrio porteresiae DSM 19223]
MDFLNQGKIDGLAQEIGQENVPVLLEIFLGELTSYEQQLSQISGAEQYEYLKEISHALKSSAASFGADRLCAKAVEIDGMVKLGLEFEVNTEAERMMELLKATFARYQQLLP